MKALTISGSLRENVGKKDAKMHRREAKVPCVLYGGKEQVHFVATEKDFKKLIFTPEIFIVNLQINGKEYNAILQDIQYHPVTDSILHIDFMQIFDEKPVIISVPVNFTGVAPGVLKGGKLIRKIRKLKIKALPQYLPDDIMVDISELNIAGTIKVADLVRENIQFLDPLSSVVVTIVSTRGVAGEDEAGADAKPAAGAPKAKAKK
jgi:large subunit ribosomal protein L25